METQKFVVTAVGKNRLEILNRIASLYLQRNIPVESFILSKDRDGNSRYKICAQAPESSIIKIVNQINNIVDISKVDYSI